MKTRQVIMCIAFSLLSHAFAKAQQINYITYTDSSVLNSKEYLKGNNYQKDFLLFMDMLKNTHPAFSLSNPPFDIKKIKKEGYKYLKNFDNTEKFGFYLESIVSEMNDGHTFIYNQYKKDVLFPLIFRYFDGGFYINTINEEHKAFLGKKIVMLNGFAIYDVIMSFGHLLSWDNDIFLIERFKCITKFIWQDSKYNTQEPLTVTCDDGSSFDLYYENIQDIKWVSVEPQPQQSPYKNIQIPFRYELYTENSICYLQFSSCIDKNTLRFQYYSGDLVGISEDEFEEQIKDIPQFDTFLQEVFDMIQKHDIKTLVVDMRGNSGGNSMLCDQLLSWLRPYDEIQSFDTKIRVSKFMDAHYPEIVKSYKESAGDKFEYGMIFNDLPNNPDSIYSRFCVLNHDNNRLFKGNVVFIQDNGTFSSAATLIVTAYDNKIGTIIGEEGSYRPCNYGDILGFELPNTKVKGGVSHCYFLRPDKNACCNETLIPTIHIQRTWHDYLEGRDPWWQWVLDNYK